MAPVTAGDIVLGGVSIANRNEDGAIPDDVAYVPERPLDNAVVADLDLGVEPDAAAGDASCRSFRRRRALTARAGELITRFDVRPPHPALPAAALSGGNLQKLVIARELSDAHRLVIASYPTWGSMFWRHKLFIAPCSNKPPAAPAWSGSRRSWTTFWLMHTASR